MMLAHKLALRLVRGGAPRVYASGYAPSATQLRISVPRRTYATPGRPKGAVGEPTKTIKRAVKRAAVTTDPTIAVPATKKPSAKTKAKATKGPKAPTVKQQQMAERRAAAKKIKDAAAAAKQAAAAAKAAAKAKITSARQQKIDLEADFAELKRLALNPPNALSTRGGTAWTTFNGEISKTSLKGASGGDVRSRLSAATKENAVAYKALSPAEREHYNHLANESNAQKQRDNKAWVEQYTPDQIRIANLARHRLRTSFAKVKAYPNIPDARQVKRPANIYACFVAERMASGDLKHILIRKGAAKLIADEWRALNDTEKQKYQEAADREFERYQREYLEVYGHEPKTTRAT